MWFKAAPYCSCLHFLGFCYIIRAKYRGCKSYNNAISVRYILRLLQNQKKEDDIMKKKGLLGILAVLMVIALALRAAGSKASRTREQTGSEGQNGTITDNGNENNGEATAEPEESDTTMNGIGNRHPK
jgi:hypothetical protein